VNRLFRLGVAVLLPFAAGAQEETGVPAVFAPVRVATLSAEVAGPVIRVARRMGERFEQGEVLFEIEPLPFRIRLGGAKAAAAHAKAKLEEAESLDRDRVRIRKAEAVLAAAKTELAALETLHRTSQASTVELARARRDAEVAQTELAQAVAGAPAALEAARRDLAAAEAELALAERALAACTVRAPWSGCVARLAKQEHERVEPGSPLVDLIDDRALLARFLAPASLLSRLEPGRSIALRVRETGAVVRGRLVRVHPALDPASRTIEAWVETENPGGALRPGMNALAMLEE